MNSRMSRHPVLQQVADAAGPVGEQLGRVLPLDVLAQDEDRRARDQPTRLDRRTQPLVALGGRHPDVDDRHVGPVLDDRGDQRRAVADLGHDDAARIGDQAGEPFADEHGIVGDDDAQGGWVLRRLGVHASIMHQWSPRDPTDRRDRRPLRPGAQRVVLRPARESIAGCWMTHGALRS